MLNLTGFEALVRRGSNGHVARAVVLVCAVLWSVSAAQAADKSAKVFVIANYPVEARAKDAVTAKRKAYADGQQAAFRSLLKRIVPVTAYPRLKRLASVSAEQLLDGVSVLSERNSSTEYIATLDFSFSAQAVRDLLRREGVPFIDTAAQRITLVPTYRADSKSDFGRSRGDWFEAWKGLDLDNTVTPAAVQPLKKEIHRDTLNMVQTGDPGGQRIMANEYGAAGVVTAFAELDPPAKRLHVTLAGRDAVGPFSWKRSYRVFDDDVAYAMEYAAVVGLGVLEGRWKAIRASERGGVDVLSGPGETVTIRVEFAGLSEWYQLRRKLQAIEGAQDVQETGVSARSAQISMRYPGGGPQLAVVLARQGLTLSDNGAGRWLLRRSF